MYRPDNPLIVQGDRSVLLEVHAPGYEAARDLLARFAELEKSPEHVHTYRITPLSLWNACSSGLGADAIVEGLTAHSKYDLPQNLVADIREYVSRYGRIKLVSEPGRPELVLRVSDRLLFEELSRARKVKPLVVGTLGHEAFLVPLVNRGVLKKELVHLGYPVEDLAGFAEGAPLVFSLRERTLAGHELGLRPYQTEAIDTFVASGTHGAVVLPCGAGKTVVALGVLERLQTQALILCTNVAAVHQWIAELLDKTTLSPQDIGEYSGSAKEVRPVTVATYHVITRKRKGEYPHFSLFNAREWGLIIYDEVHLLPAPVFRITAELQARKRLGLTATLVREDGLEEDVYSLIGPKRYDVPWKELEQKGFIAEAVCHELRLDLPVPARLAYAAAEPKERLRISAENPRKIALTRELVTRHAEDRVLVIGHYIAQLKELAHALQAPLVTGETANAEREKLYDAFRTGREKVLVCSRVANFSLDLPEANVLVQVSGTFGSRQEEAQRLGRILRPKPGVASFYTLVTKETVEQEFALHRQLFLAEQGYRYRVSDWAPPPGDADEAAAQLPWELEGELEDPVTAEPGHAEPELVGEVVDEPQGPPVEDEAPRPVRRVPTRPRIARPPGKGGVLPDNVIPFPLDRVRRRS